MKKKKSGRIWEAIKDIVAPSQTWNFEGGAVNSGQQHSYIRDPKKKKGPKQYGDKGYKPSDGKGVGY